MSGVALILLALAVLILGVVLALIGWLLRDFVKKQVPVDAGLAAQLNVEDVEGFTSGRAVTRAVGAGSCVLRHIQGNRNHPPGVSFTFPAIVLPRLTITREEPFHRFFKKIGLTEEIATGDARFDDQYFLRTDETHFYRDFFSDARRRGAVRAIFTADPGVVKLQATSAGLSVIGHVRTTPSGVVLPTLNPEAMAKIVSVLDAGPPWRSTGHDSPHAGIRPVAGLFSRVVALSAMIGLVLVLGIIMLAAGIAVYRTRDDGFLWNYALYALVPLIFFWLLLFRVLRGHAWSHLAFVPMALASLLAFPLAGMGGAAFLNGYLDEGPAVTRKVTVLEKSIGRNRNSLSYSVTFSDWKPARPGLTFPVSKYFYDSVKAGDSLDVVTHPGYLGQEWVESIAAAGVSPE